MTTSAPERTWEQFVDAIAVVAPANPDDVGRDTRLVEDLGLDSLALTEVVVLLVVDFRLRAELLEQRDWSGVTAGQLYEEYRSANGA